MLKKLSEIISLIIIFGTFGVFPAVASAASLTFNPSSGSLNKGCDVTIDVNLDTQGVQTDGTDMIIIYNPAQLSITTDQITKGTIYPEYPGISVDSAGGKIGISGVSAVANPYTGSGVFAKFKFKVASTLATGTPINLSFDFDPNNKTKTTDSNVIERGTIADVLSTVTNGTYTVGTGNCAAGITASPSPLASGFGGQGQTLPNTTSTNPTSSQSAQYPVYQPNINQLPNAGLFDNTMALTAVGVILVVLGIAGLAML